MSQSKIGNGYYFVWGNATRDAEFRRVGDKRISQTRFSIAWDNGKNEDTHYLDCKAWRGCAGEAKKIKKGDYVACIGKIIESTTLKKDGTPFIDMDVDIIVSHYARSYGDDGYKTKSDGDEGGFEELADEIGRASCRERV